MTSASGLVFILDDDARICRSVARLLRSSGLRVKVFTSHEKLLAERPVTEPACLILDLKLGSTNGLEVMKLLRQRGHHFTVIFLSAYGNVPAVVEAMKQGAFDFIEKPFDPETLTTAVSKGLALARSQMREEADLDAFQTRAATLTPREHQVVELVTLGYLNKEIANQLNLAEVTVKVHRARAMRRLGVHNTAELSRVATLLKQSPRADFKENC
jgi:FixJ family two-component response regulator